MTHNVYTPEFIAAVKDGSYNENDVLRYCNAQPRLMPLFKSLCDAASTLIASKGIKGGFVWNLTERRFHFDDQRDLRLYMDVEVARLQNAIGIVCDLIEKQPLQEQSSDAPSLNQKPQQETTKPTRGRGRPKETFSDKMEDEEKKSRLEKIHKAMKGRIGKDAALIILACIELGWITKPTYTQVKNEFGEIGAKSGFNNYLKASRFTKEEIDGAKESLK